MRAVLGHGVHALRQRLAWAGLDGAACPVWLDLKQGLQRHAPLQEPVQECRSPQCRSQHSQLAHARVARVPESHELGEQICQDLQQSRQAGRRALKVGDALQLQCVSSMQAHTRPWWMCAASCTKAVLLAGECTSPSGLICSHTPAQCVSTWPDVPPRLSLGSAHLFLISGRRAPHLRLPTKRFFTARLVRPGSSREIAFQLLP